MPIRPGRRRVFIITQDENVLNQASPRSSAPRTRDTQVRLVSTEHAGLASACLSLDFHDSSFAFGRGPPSCDTDSWASYAYTHAQSLQFSRAPHSSMVYAWCRSWTPNTPAYPAHSRSSLGQQEDVLTVMVRSWIFLLHSTRILHDYHTSNFM